MLSRKIIAFRNDLSDQAFSLFAQLGMGCMIAGSLMDLAALPFIPQSRVAVLGSTGIIFNVLITPLFLGEKLTK